MPEGVPEGVPVWSSVFEIQRSHYRGLQKRTARDFRGRGLPLAPCKIATSGSHGEDPLVRVMALGPARVRS